MPATTRSKSNPKQTHLEDYQERPGKKEKANTSKSRHPLTPNAKDTKSNIKRKQPDDEDKPDKSSTPTKKQKQTSIKPDKDEAPTQENAPVIINRAPVLQLWATCVAQKLYPKLSWATHLSIGSAISALCAVSKGRAIGKIDQPSDDADKKAEKDRQKGAAAEDAEDEVNVMGFKMLVKDGSAIVSGKPHNANEALLQKKYGGDYERTKKAMEEAVDIFERRAKKGELHRLGFQLYEEFRPNVQRGGRGWGKKGELRLEKIKELAERR